MINPGEGAVADATVEVAEDTIADFVAAVAERGGQLAGAPVRDPEHDGDGRYGYTLVGVNGRIVRTRIPGAPAASLLGLSSQVPCVYVDDLAWWWRDAVTQTAASIADRRSEGSEVA
ncbi:hypothetical protein AB0I61_32920 [Polymorphospora rubra]|uniref:hypothetical protein n=1 Tax=Polymorphospora rubra TaxID=338584 RepID=UPI0034075DDC